MAENVTLETLKAMVQKIISEHRERFLLASPTKDAEKAAKEKKSQTTT